MDDVMGCRSALPGCCGPSLSSFLSKKEKEQREERSVVLWCRLKLCAAGLG